ncbi:MAG: hypothetical protein M3082_17955 [Candidatus Dormibacteraeota bacterium]|nr:hypothetical protein [Candidatus Dormibacteraeota bacterium]
MKLSERFDRRYQQAPAVTPVVPAAPPSNGPVVTSAPTPVTVPVPIPTLTVATQPVPAALVTESSARLSPPLATAKAEIHSQLLAHFTAQIDI